MRLILIFVCFGQKRKIIQNITYSFLSQFQLYIAIFEYGLLVEVRVRTLLFTLSEKIKKNTASSTITLTAKLFT